MKIILRTEAEKVAPICQQCVFWGFCEKIKIVYFDKTKKAIHIKFFTNEGDFCFFCPFKKFVLQLPNLKRKKLTRRK